MGYDGGEEETQMWVVTTAGSGSLELANTVMLTVPPCCQRGNSARASHLKLQHRVLLINTAEPTLPGNYTSISVK